MTNKKIITIAVSVAIVHFILTSVISHYIAVQIGTQMGKIVAEGLMEGNDKTSDKSEEDATRIYQNMKTKSDDINKSWEIPQMLISLPAKPLIMPILKELRQKTMNDVIAKRITREQVYTRLLIVDYSVKFLNSLSLGLLIYIMLRIFSQYKGKR